MAARRSSVRISKLLSLMLRHRPEDFGVEVDRYGYADLGAVLAALRERDPEIDMEDIDQVVYDSEKQRFEIQEGRIRARYGHSFEVDLGSTPVEPPEWLYKGVDPVEADRVLQEGLKPEDRQYVHLSFEADVAAQLGGRERGPNAVIRVAALRAHQGGVAFYDCGPTILTPEIPAEFLSLESRPSEPSRVSRPSEPSRVSRPSEPPSDAGQDPEPGSDSVSYGRRRKFRSRR